MSHGLAQGTLYELASVDEATALAAFDAVVADPGSFSIITRDQSRVDFLFARPFKKFINRLLRRPDTIALDIWFEEEQPALVEAFGLSMGESRLFVQEVFRDVRDADLWRLLGPPRIVE